jgi:parvulin-like peptidyl-prolyl isomerase
MKASKLIVTLALSAVLFTGCGVTGQKAIIKINDNSITQAQYDDAINKSLGSSPFGQMGDVKGNKDGFFYLITEQRVVNNLIMKELLNQEVKNRGIKVSNKDVDSELKKVIEQVGGKERLAEILKQNGVTASDLRKDIENQVKMQKLALSAGKISISDKDCENYYKKNIDKFKNPEQVRASHILIEANPYQIQEEIKSKSKKEISEADLKAKVEAKMAEKKEFAEKIAKELQADKTKFAQYAKKYSADIGSAKQGGDLGFFGKEQMVPEFANVAFSIKPDTVSDVVKTQYGYHIILVQDRRAAATAPYEKVKAQIKQHLTTEKQIAALDKIIASAKKKASIEYVEERYNPEVIQKKLSKQVDNATGGAASKIKEQSKKNQKK